MRDGEREKVEGEGTALVFIEDSYFGFDHRPKSTRDILRYRYLVIFTQSYFETLANNEITCFKIFLLFQRFFWCS